MTDSEVGDWNGMVACEGALNLMNDNGPRNGMQEKEGNFRQSEGAREDRRNRGASDVWQDGGSWKEVRVVAEVLQIPGVPVRYDLSG